MPFLVFTYAEPEIKETAKYVFFRETTRRGILLHPNHHWFTSAAHTAQDVEHVLEVSQEAFQVVKQELARGFRAPTIHKVSVTVADDLKV